MTYPHVLHCFMPGHTIDAIIRMKARVNLSQDEMEELRRRFNVLNGEKPVHVGTTCKIPLHEAVEDEGGID
jgi:hypothetical protein